MSVIFSGMVSRKCIDEDLLEDVLINFFSSQYTLIKEIREKGPLENCIFYAGITEKNNVSMTFVDNGDSLECDITKEDFKYAQDLIFYINKEDATIDMCKKIIDFFVFLRQKINSDILIDSDVYDNICLLKDQEIIWSIDPETGNGKNVWFDFPSSGN